METKFKTKTNITAYLEIAPNVFANVDGKALLEWSLDIQIKDSYIDSINLHVPDQTVELIAKSNEIHPETGEEIELEGKSFNVSLNDIEIDTDAVSLNSVIEPEEVFCFKNRTCRASFTSSK